MEKFEYKVIESINECYFNELGAEGWQLISASPRFGVGSQIHNGSYMKPDGFFAVFMRRTNNKGKCHSYESRYPVS